MMIGRFKSQTLFTVYALTVAITACLLVVAGCVGAKRNKTYSFRTIETEASTNFVYEKGNTVRNDVRFATAKSKTELAANPIGGYLLGLGFLPGEIPALKSEISDGFFAYAAAEIIVKPVNGGAEKRIGCAFSYYGFAFPYRLRPEVFASLLKTPGEYNLRIAITLFSVSGEDLVGEALASWGPDGSLEVPCREFSIAEDGTANWPHLNALLKKYPHQELRRDYGKINVFAKIPEGFFTAISPTPKLTAKIKDNLNITYDRNEFLTLNYQDLPCGVLFRAEVQLKGEDKWRSWQDVAIPAAQEGSNGRKVSPALTSGEHRLKIRLTPLEGVKRWTENSINKTIKSYYGGAVETDWIDLVVPARQDAAKTAPDVDANMEKGTMIVETDSDILPRADQ